MFCDLNDNLLSNKMLFHRNLFFLPSTDRRLSLRFVFDITIHKYTPTAFHSLGLAQWWNCKRFEWDEEKQKTTFCGISLSSTHTHTHTTARALTHTHRQYEGTFVFGPLSMRYDCCCCFQHTSSTGVCAVHSRC